MTVQNRLTISGFWVTGPIELGLEPHIAWEGVKTATGRRFYYWSRVRMFSDNSVQNILTIDPTLQTTAIDATDCRPTWFDNYRAHDSDPLAPGFPCVVAAWFEGGGGFSRVWRTYPSIANMTAGTPGGTTVFGTAENPATPPPDVGVDPSIGFTHQGRAVACDQGSYFHGTTPTDVWTHNENIWYTNANLATLASPSTASGSFTNFGMENATGYMVAVSTSFAELLLIKVAGGGLLLRGDIDFPTVIRLPGIPHIGPLHQAACTTPVGVVFLTSNGPYLWSGAENAEAIAADAISADDFLIPPGGDPDGTDFIDFFGRMYYWYDWVVFPNNWCWNWKQQSWWRLDDPEVLQIFYAGPSFGDRLYCAPANVQTGAPSFYGYDRGTPATTWRWTQQPVPLLEDREFVIRELVYVVSGTGTLTFTHFQRDGTSEVHTVTASNENRPQYFRQNAHVRCQEVRTQIDCSGSCIVHEVRFGIQTDTHMPNNAI